MTHSIRVPLHDLIDVTPIPDPDYIDEDNRRVNVRHAKEFGLYLKNSRWVAPALLARDAGSCTYAPRSTALTEWSATSPSRGRTAACP